MIGVAACVIAFVVCWQLTARWLGHGLGALVGVGFFYGIFRANFLDGGSHFVFDAALLGCYVGAFFSARRRPRGDRRLRPWIVALCAWPTLIALVPLQHPLVQLVGLRAATLFVPVALLGAQADERQLQLLARWLVGLVLASLAFAAAEYVLGVPRFYPYNAVTDIIYRSSDAGGGNLRIPATFINAHAYGGTMVLCVPLLLAGLKTEQQHRWRLGFMAALVAAAVGVFICAARQPVVYLFALGAFALTLVRLAWRVRAALVVAAVVVGAIVVQSERMQRFTTLAQTEKVERRIHGSVNKEFVELILEHPMGEGLGSAVGTSIPHFLAHLAPRPIGMENEWGRIAVEQGLVGLGLWLAFVGATLLRWPGRGRPSFVRLRLAWAMVGMTWATAFIGTGTLMSIPATALLVLYMGTLWRDAPPPRRARRRRPAALAGVQAR